MEVVGRLAGGIAHDFNNLLTAIMGNLSLALMMLPEDDGAYQTIKDAMKASESAAGITRQLLSFSRKESRSTKTLSLNSVIKNTEKMIRHLLGESVVLTTCLSPYQVLMRGDEGHIEQLLVNLSVNARDAMSGEGKLVIETEEIILDKAFVKNHAELSPGKHVMLTVRDTGTGIAPDVLPHIFEPFFTTKPKDKGTGLGLSTVYGIVRQNGGVITVYSHQNIGTTFKVYFPAAENEHPEDAPMPVPIELPRGNETIFLVEDEELVRTMAHKMLSGLGYRVYAFSSGIDAVEGLGLQCFLVDLLLTDIVMPRMNGRELAGYFREKCPEIKILLSSGYTDEIIEQNKLISEELPFISKPYSLEMLALKIRSVLDA